MARGCNGDSAEPLLGRLGALVPLASPVKQERFWYDFRSCGFGVLSDGTTWVSSFDRFAPDNTPIDVDWSGGVSSAHGH